VAAADPNDAPAIFDLLLRRKLRMDNAKLNKWLTLLANMSVVAGIVFLGIEVRQNTQTLEQNALYMRLALMDVGYEQTTDWRNMLVANDGVGDLWEKGCKSELTKDEATDYDLLSSTWLIQHRNLYDRANVLGGEEAAALMAEATAGQLLNCQFLQDKFLAQNLQFIISPNWKPAVVNALARLESKK
jgi:hypothetical protein